MWSAVFRKFPGLRVALSEGGIGWIPYFQERIDNIYKRTRHWSGMDLGDRLPSEVFREHVLLCFIDDATGIRNRHHLELDNIMWECDYPHSDSDWPRSPEALSRNLAGVSDEEIDKITHLNAMRHFRYDPFTHIPRAAATVGALRRRDPDWDIAIRSTAHLRPAAATHR